MEFYAFNPTKIRTLHVDPGEDILSSVEQFFAEANLKQAVVLGGYGAMAAYHLNSRTPKSASFSG